MRKIGIFGGTFNPIHRGHIHIARAFFEHLHLDSVLIIPTQVPVHKAPQGLISGEERLEMCRIAARNDPHFFVSAIEVERKEKSYTYLTIQRLRERYPDAALYLIMGSDMFLSFTTWYRYRDILQEATLCAAARKNRQQEELAACARRLREEGGRCVVLDLNVVDISSTELRARIQAGDDVSGYLDGAVEDYIRERGLYGHGAQSGK
ncbi:nicotinate-nucleotide adenylyltransferase [Zongyangia hominis]|uniref:Probable nicotinate-nucleotide adenylyltransferase n=1 Tax=Zongyangia hominis TaxID=2763677 RepID=A0A926ECJ4_9FIRM|nr:nicotinate-nucleotide adenylyltransferase [Zongyangia hominis]MBC8569262.1 nicotinate (nicotinamide) nucleotide adenylyltransferase [Zongyangia hominis]